MVIIFVKFTGWCWYHYWGADLNQSEATQTSNQWEARLSCLQDHQEKYSVSEVFLEKKSKLTENLFYKTSRKPPKLRCSVTLVQVLWYPPEKKRTSQGNLKGWISWLLLTWIPLRIPASWGRCTWRAPGACRAAPPWPPSPCPSSARTVQTLAYGDKIMR